MAQNEDVPDSPDRDVTQPPEAAEPVPAAPAPVLKTRWRDRAWTFRAMLAVALASLVIGGVGGLVVGVAAAHQHDRRDGFHHRFGPGGGPGMGPGWRMRGGPGGRWNDDQRYGGPGGPASPLPTPSTPSPTAPGSAS
jgi:hypothetical protein